MTEYRIVPEETRETDAGVLYNFRSGLTLTFLESERAWLLWRRTWWTGKVNPETPLMWYDKKTKLYYMPDLNVNRTDLGSVPPPAQNRFPPTEAPYGYYMHDTSYRCHGLYACDKFNGEFKLHRMARQPSDEMCLLDILEAGGMGPQYRRNIVYYSVRVGGSGPWKDSHKAWIAQKGDRNAQG